MAVIERRHQKMFLVSQALLMFDKPMTAESDYWAERARVLLNISQIEANMFKQFTQKNTIEEYVAHSDELKRTKG